jgi:hypothetical protein
MIDDCRLLIDGSVKSKKQPFYECIKVEDFGFEGIFLKSTIIHRQSSI